MRKLYGGLIPYTSDGRPIFYTSSKYPRLPVDYSGTGLSNVRPGSWRDNIPFPAQLRVIGMHRGHSSAHFLLENTDNSFQYVMFMTDMLDLIQNHTIVSGVVTGTWAFTKRGQNYGIIYFSK